MAALGRFVGLFGENSTDEPDDRVAGREHPDGVGASADLAAKALGRVLGPDLGPDVFRELGEGQDVGAGPAYAPRVTTAPPSSGSPAFDALRDALVRDSGLRSELEAALDLNVHRVNPSDRALRFGSGGAVEWILAATAFTAGVLSVPGGHNANGFDLRDLKADAKGLWSVKNATAPSKSDFRLTNGIGGAGAGFTEPVVFLSPHLPGLTFVDPMIHRDVAARVKAVADATVLSFRAVADHADAHPECVAPCRMPRNPGTGLDDPWMSYVEDLLSPNRFPRLSTLFAAAKPAASSLAGELQALVAQRDAGNISAEQFDVLVRRLGT